MGLSLSDGGGIYLSTFDGFFEQKLKEPKPGSVQRVNKMGDTINVFRFDTLVGKIVKVEYREGQQKEFGDSWLITVVDDRVYKLNLSVNNASTFSFLNRLINRNLDLKAPVLIKVFSEVVGEKKRMVLLIQQKGKWINSVYTKDDPQDLPQMEQIMFKNKLEWDSTKRDRHMRNLVETYVIPELDQDAVPSDAENEALDGPHEDVEVPDWAKDEPWPSKSNPAAQSQPGTAKQSPPNPAPAQTVAQPKTPPAAKAPAGVPPREPQKARGAK